MHNAKSVGQLIVDRQKLYWTASEYVQFDANAERRSGVIDTIDVGQLRSTLDTSCPTLILMTLSNGLFSSPTFSQTTASTALKTQRVRLIWFPLYVICRTKPPARLGQDETKSAQLKGVEALEGVRERRGSLHVRPVSRYRSEGAAGFLSLSDGGRHLFQCMHSTHREDAMSPTTKCAYLCHQRWKPGSRTRAIFLQAFFFV